MSKRAAIWMLVLASLLWSTSGVMIKLSDLSPLALVGGRSVLASLTLLAVVGRPHFTWSPAQIGGALCLVATQVLFVVSTRMTSAANAILLQYTAPIYVALFGTWFLGERAKRSDWLAMAAIGLGMALFFGDELSADGYLGNLLAVISGLTMAWMTLFMRKQKDGSPTETMLLGNILAALIGLPFLLAERPAGVDWAIIGYLGIFQLGIPFALYSRAITRLQAVEAVLIQTLEPIANPLLVFLVVGEQPGPLALVGGAIVVAAICARALASAFAERRAAAAPVAVAAD